MPSVATMPTWAVGARPSTPHGPTLTLSGCRREAGQFSLLPIVSLCSLHGSVLFRGWFCSPHHKGLPNACACVRACVCVCVCVCVMLVFPSWLSA